MDKKDGLLERVELAFEETEKRAERRCELKRGSVLRNSEAKSQILILILMCFQLHSAGHAQNNKNISHHADAVPQKAGLTEHLEKSEETLLTHRRENAPENGRIEDSSQGKFGSCTRHSKALTRWAEFSGRRRRCRRQLVSLHGGRAIAPWDPPPCLSSNGSGHTRMVSPAVFPDSWVTRMLGPSVVPDSRVIPECLVL